jgi:hypothetical protein
MEKLKYVYLTPPLKFSEIMTSQDSYIGSEKRQYASEVIETEIHDEWGTVVEEIPEDNKMPLNSLMCKLLQCFYLPTSEQYGEYVIEFKSFHQNGNISETVA